MMKLNCSIWWTFLFFFFVADQLEAKRSNLTAEVKTLMADAEYKKAQQRISQGLLLSKIDHRTLKELFWLEATCFISLGEDRSARSAFLKLLAIQPSFEPDPLTSPKVVKVFEFTKSQFVAAGGFDTIYQPQMRPLGTQKAGRLVHIDFSVGNRERAKDIQKVTLHLRKLGTSDFAAMNFVKMKNRHHIATIPSALLPTASDPYAMEYFVEAKSDQGTRLTGVGSSSMPLSFVVISDFSPHGESKISPVSKHSSWPYWVGVGAGVVGGIVVSAIALSGPKVGSLRVTIRNGS